MMSERYLDAILQILDHAANGYYTVQSASGKMCRLCGCEPGDHKSFCPLVIACAAIDENPNEVMR